MDCETCKFPTLTKQAANIGLSLFNVVTQALKTGQVKADNKTIEDRVNKCQGCEHLKESRCSQCGCFIALKAGLKSEKCPLEKW